MSTVAESLVAALSAAGVRRIYGIVGDSLNGITDEIRREKTIEWVHVRHEEVAAFAAGADAHVTGEIAVCAGSCGPGNLHLINGLFDCHRSRVPVLQLRHRFRVTRSVVGIFRRPIRNTCSRTAAITANWCHSLSRCRASWPLPCGQPSRDAA